MLAEELQFQDELGALAEGPEDEPAEEPEDDPQVLGDDATAPLGPRQPILPEQSPAPPVSFLEQVLRDCPEAADARSQEVYFTTMSRVLEETIAARGNLRDLSSVSRRDILLWMHDVLENPEQTRLGGRPRAEAEPRVEFLVAYRELHEDKSVHYHVVVKL